MDRSPRRTFLTEMIGAGAAAPAAAGAVCATQAEKWSDARAQGARGEDPYGERAEFVQMVRAAQGLPARAVP